MNLSLRSFYTINTCSETLQIMETRDSKFKVNYSLFSLKAKQRKATQEKFNPIRKTALCLFCWNKIGLRKPITFLCPFHSCVLCCFCSKENFSSTSFSNFLSLLWKRKKTFFCSFFRTSSLKEAGNYTSFSLFLSFFLFLFQGFLFVLVLKFVSFQLQHEEERIHYTIQEQH